MLPLDSLYSASIVEAIRDPLIVVGNDLRIKGANSAFYNYFNTTEHDTTGSILFDLSDGQWQNDNLKQQVSKVKSTMTKAEDLELKISMTETGERILLLNIYPILDKNTDEYSILITLNDVTTIRTENSFLGQKIKTLEESNKELSSFSYIAGHDLQDPLRKINTFSKMILDDRESTLSEESTEHLSRILVSTKRMQQLTEDLLNYSHIGSSDYYQLFDTALNTIINESLEELSDSITAKEAIITVSALPVIRAVPPLVRQLFINLIGNAIKYTGKNITPVISINGIETNNSEIPILLQLNNLHEKYYKITITDNGIGFTNEQALKIFEPFYRLHSKDKYEGTGIGLAICKKIMIKHQGSIIADSSPGNGSAFTLYFPI